MAYEIVYSSPHMAELSFQLINKAIEYGNSKTYHEDNLADKDNSNLEWIDSMQKIRKLSIELHILSVSLAKENSKIAISLAKH